MNSLLVHGCYDGRTLETLKNLGTKELAFDLRGRSSNLITFKDLTVLLKELSSERVFLTFAADKKETILSYQNLLKDFPIKFELIFRDSMDASYYKNLDLPFYWMFNQETDWKSILELPNLKGVLLPVKLQGEFQKLPELWEIIEERNLETYLHAETFEETIFLNLGPEIKLSLDLSREVEEGYRKVDQEKLKTMKLWRKFNENSAGQR